MKALAQQLAFGIEAIVGDRSQANDDAMAVKAALARMRRQSLSLPYRREFTVLISGLFFACTVIALTTLLAGA